MGLTAILFAQESHYQLGVGAGVVNYPSYIGSKSTNQIITPIPYIRYEGEKNHIGKGGIRHDFFKSDSFSIDLSLGASLPVNSDNVPLREGMEDLDFTLEVGPRLSYKLYKDETHELSFKLPIRTVIATDIKKFSIQGFLLTPNMNYQFTRERLKIKLKTGPLWADKKYHNYFYGVKSKDATLQRKEYEAKGGYNGYRNTLSLKYKQGAWNYGGFVSHFNISGAVFETSPLVETKNALFWGTFISYVFYEK